MITANLIPLPRRLERQRRTRVRRWFAAWCAAGSLMASGVAGAALTWETSTGGVEAELAGVSTKALDVGGDVKLLAAEIDKCKKKLAANRAVGDQPDWSIVLALVSKVLGEDVHLRKLQVRIDAPVIPAVIPGQPVEKKPLAAAEPTYIVRLTGLAPTPTAVSKVILELEATQFFTRVELIETKSADASQSESGLQNQVMFEIECRLGRGARS